MDADALRPYELGVRLLDLLRRLYPDDFAFLPPVRADGKPFISLLAGHREFEKPDWTRTRCSPAPSARARSLRAAARSTDFTERGKMS